MSIHEIKKSYDYSTEPSKEIISILDKIYLENCKIESYDKSTLVNILNVVSNTNKDNILNKFKLLLNEWTDEYTNIFINVICKQNLYTEIYVKMCTLLPSKYQNQILNRLLEYNNSTHPTNELKTIGEYIGHWIIYKNYSNGEIYEFINRSPINKKCLMIINMFITFCKSGNKNLIPIVIVERINKLDIDTPTKILLYDLEDLL